MGVQVSMAELQAFARMNFAGEDKDWKRTFPNQNVSEKSRAKTTLVAGRQSPVQHPVLVGYRSLKQILLAGKVVLWINKLKPRGKFIEYWLYIQRENATNVHTDI